MGQKVSRSETVAALLNGDGDDIWYLETVLGFPFTQGNAVEVFRNGDEIFPAMLRAIRGASRCINFATYVYWTGNIAERFAEALAEKSREGVEVRVLLDAHGASKMRGTLVKAMKNAGVDVRWFRPIRLRFWDYDKRTHRKLLVCDQSIAFTGGVGVASEWEGDARNPNEWRETHFSFCGPSVRYLEAAFWDDWFEVDDHALTRLEKPPKSTTERLDDAGSSAVQIVQSSPSTHQSQMERLFFAMLRLAKRRLRIVTPYFVPRRRFTNLIRARARAGLQVEFMIPGDNIDQHFEACVADTRAPALIEAGVKMWRYEKTMIHAKIWIIDDEIACVGSPNLNRRSSKKDDEVAAVIKDPEIVATLNRHFEEDLEHCHEMNQRELKGRYWRRLKALAIAPFREQF